MPAKLTSLEEMMKAMMDEEVVHRDILNKPWQVYSKYACSECCAVITLCQVL